MEYSPYYDALSINSTSDMENMSSMNQYPVEPSFPDPSREMVGINYQANPMPLEAYNICTDSITGNLLYFTRNGAFTSPYGSAYITEPSYYQTIERTPYEEYMSSLVTVPPVAGASQNFYASEQTLFNYLHDPTAIPVPQFSVGEKSINQSNRTNGTLRSSNGVRYKYTPIKARITSAEKSRVSTKEESLLSPVVLDTDPCFISPQVESKTNQMPIHAPVRQPAADVDEASSISTGIPKNLNEGKTLLPLVRFIRDNIIEINMEPKEDLDENVPVGVPQVCPQEKLSLLSTVRGNDTSPISPEVSRKNTKRKKLKLEILMEIPLDGSFFDSGETPKKSNQSEPALSLPVSNMGLFPLSPEIQKRQPQILVQDTAPRLITTETSPIAVETRPLTSTQKTKRGRPINPAVVTKWQCNPCNRMFHSERGLCQHNAHHHSGDKPFVCKTCGKKFQDEHKLQEHQRRHTAQAKLHKCQECPRQYYLQCDLKRHVDMQHGNSRFTCKYCEKHFGRTDHLLYHERCHEKGTVKSKIRV